MGLGHLGKKETEDVRIQNQYKVPKHFEVRLIEGGA